MFATIVVITKVIIARTPVKAILPLKFPLNGKKGINPIILFIQIKKNSVKRNGTYFSYLSSPIKGSATYSLINKTIGSVNFAIPTGSPLFDLAYDLADNLNKIKIIMIDKNIENTSLVIEKSKGF